MTPISDIIHALAASMQNTVPAAGQETQRAAQVCSHCKSIKKGCDKRLPSCSQCIKRRAVCRYNNDGDERKRSGSESSNAASSSKRHEHFTSEWPTIPRELRNKFSPSIRLSMLLINSLSDVFPTGLANTSYISPSTDVVLQSQINHIICADGKEVDAVVSQYFLGIHVWLPILSRKRFFDRLAHFRVNPSADFSVLLLAMRLLTQYPSMDKETDQDREVLYLATKTMFAQVQAFIPSSLLLAQTGIILAHYEHAHGMIEGAYVTIGTTARMAFALGLHNTHCSLALQGSDAWLDEEEALSTWWGLVILDRIIAFDTQTSGRPLATRPIRENDYLPIESSEMDTASEFIHPKTRYFVSALNLPAVGTFGREAQATFLYDKVRLAIDAGKTGAYYLYPLGRELQALLGTVMEQVAGRLGVYCGAMQMLIIAIHKLHHTALLQPPSASLSSPSHSYPNPHSSSSSNADAIMLAQNTISRMIIDIAYAFNRESATLNLEILSPAIAHIVRTAERHLLLATPQDLGDQRWLEEWDQLTRMLGFFNRRWVLAGMELHRLNGSFEMAMALQI